MTDRQAEKARRQVARARQTPGKATNDSKQALTVRIDPSLIRAPKSAEELALEARLNVRAKTPAELEAERDRSRIHWTPRRAA